MSKKQLTIILIVLALALVFVIVSFIKIPYTIHSRGLVFPVSEWTLSKVDDGNVLSVLKDNRTNSVKYFSVNEFQRGDAVSFKAHRAVLKKDYVEKDDTVGYINSNVLEHRIIELKGELDEQEYLLQVYATGQKPEDVKLAQDKMVLAQQEFETQKGIYERIAILYKDSLISDNEYEIAFNAYKVKEYNFDIARSQLSAISSGAKPEQIEYVKSRISSLELQIEQLEKRTEAYNVTAPLSGVIVKQKGNNINDEIIIKVADVSNLLVVMPIDFYEARHVYIGQLVKINTGTGAARLSGNIVDVDNTVQMINRRQVVFVTVLIDNDYEDLFLNMTVETQVVCGKISIGEYFKRAVQTVYEN